MELAADVIARFWSKVDRRGPDECWEWRGARALRGYGSLGTSNKKTERAHRVSWTIHNGPIPDGMHVCHKCDNPPCVNPAHLWLGTDADNVRDMVEKGRNFVLSGESNKQAKLTEADVIAIRKLYARGSHSNVKIGAMYGVSETLVRYIVRRVWWKHVE